MGKGETSFASWAVHLQKIEEYWEDGTVHWINSGAVNQITVTETSMYITEQAFRNSSAKWIPKNALVMALAGQGETKGMVAKLAIETTCNQSMTAIVPKKSLNSNYLFWWLTFNYQNIRNMAGGDLRDGLNLELLGNIECPTPTDEEKISIAQFLDHEAKIDTLIEKQQRLKKKRQAVISHAVTKGLNPNAPMKDSGVEWLGEVPEHWEVKRLKFLRNFITEKTTTSNKTVIALENIESWTGKYIKTESEYGGEDVAFVSGDILFGKLRPYLAKVYAASDEGVAFGDLLVYRPNENMVSQYCFYQMLSEGFITTVDSSTYGSKMPRASAEFIGEMYFLMSPLSEQKEIVESINSKLKIFEQLAENSKIAIELMQERRTVLISAAVTGKIDVRNWNALNA